MWRVAWRSIVIILGACIAIGATGSALSPAVGAASPDDAPAWQKLWHPAFKATLGARIGMEDIQRVGDRFAIVGTDERGAVVWWSDDGLEWARTRRSTTTDHGIATSIASGPADYVLGGRQWTPQPRGRIWHSSDGLRWQTASTKLPPNTWVLSVASLADGTFVVFGDGGRRELGCWMGSSADGGVTWDYRWEGDWDPGAPGGGGCVTSVVGDGDVLLGKVNLDAIGESADGVTWHELVSAEAIREAWPKGSKRSVDLGLVPLGDGRYLLGGRGRRALVWSPEGGLERIDSPVDLTGRHGSSVAVGPRRAIAVRGSQATPLVSPPTEAYAERWKQHQPVCRPWNPKIADLAAMSKPERLDCYGGRELTFDAWVPYMEYGGICEFGAPHSWIICDDRWLASGPGGTPGYLDYGLAPGARTPRGLGSADATHVRVTGHFDDPAATLCPEPGWNGKVPQGWQPMTKADFVAECRRQLIVTEIRPIGDRPTVSRRRD